MKTANDLRLFAQSFDMSVMRPHHQMQRCQHHHKQPPPKSQEWVPGMSKHPDTAPRF
jgi:hypothetical protein